MTIVNSLALAAQLISESKSFIIFQPSKALLSLEVGAFVGQFDNYMAKNYYIDGPRGGDKKIALPRNLVVWE